MYLSVALTHHPCLRGVNLEPSWAFIAPYVNREKGNDHITNMLFDQQSTF